MTLFYAKESFALYTYYFCIVGVLCFVGIRHRLQLGLVGIEKGYLVCMPEIIDRGFEFLSVAQYLNSQPLSSMVLGTVIDQGADGGYCQIALKA